MILNNYCALLATFSVAILFPQQAWSGTFLYGIGSSGTVYEIDTSSGATSQLLTSSENSFAEGLTFNPETSTFSTFSGGGANTVIEIDPSQGSYEEVGVVSGFPDSVAFSFPSVSGLTRGPNGAIVGTKT